MIYEQMCLSDLIMGVKKRERKKGKTKTEDLEFVSQYVDNLMCSIYILTDI